MHEHVKPHTKEQLDAHQVVLDLTAERNRLARQMAELQHDPTSEAYRTVERQWLAIRPRLHAAMKHADRVHGRPVSKF